jgi:hypothetical protein
MDFQTLHELIPYARYGKEKSLEMKPYPDITLAMPGRHSEDTSPKGGDFVVMVTDKGMGWKRHQFKHEHIFHDVQARYDDDPVSANLFMNEYYNIVTGQPISSVTYPWFVPAGCIDTHTFFRAVQCLAVAEHRRYAQHEAKFGGRYLPFRFVAGIAEGLWTAAAGSDVQKYGRPAVERLEKTNGLPALTKKLMS